MDEGRTIDDAEEHQEFVVEAFRLAEDYLNSLKLDHYTETVVPVFLIQSEPTGQNRSAVHLHWRGGRISVVRFFGGILMEMDSYDWIDRYGLAAAKALVRLIAAVKSKNGLVLENRRARAEVMGEIVAATGGESSKGT